MLCFLTCQAVHNVTPARASMQHSSRNTSKTLAHQPQQPQQRTGEEGGGAEERVERAVGLSQDARHVRAVRKQPARHRANENRRRECTCAMRYHRDGVHACTNVSDSGSEHCQRRAPDARQNVCSRATTSESVIDSKSARSEGRDGEPAPGWPQRGRVEGDSNIGRSGSAKQPCSHNTHHHNALKSDRK